MTGKRLAVSVAAAGCIVAAAAGLRYAEGAGILEADNARRAMQVLIGLLLAAYANYMPKQLGRARSSPRAETRAQAALRVGGWSFTMAGLAYAGLWAFAPLAFADVASVAVIVAAMAATAGYAFWSLTACRSSGDESVTR